MKYFLHKFKKNYLLNLIFVFQSDDGWEEVFDFIFPEDESQRPHLKVLASAKAWKQKAMMLANQNNSESQETDENNESTNAQTVEPNNEKADLKFLAAAKAWKQKHENVDDKSDSPAESQETGHEVTEPLRSETVDS